MSNRLPLHNRRNNLSFLRRGDGAAMPIIFSIIKRYSRNTPVHGRRFSHHASGAASNVAASH